MPTLMTMNQLRNRLVEAGRNHYDSFVPTSELKFDSLEVMRIGDDPVRLQPTAQAQIANRLSVPLHYLRRCSTTLQATNLNAWITQETNRELFVRFSGGEARAVLTPKYRTADNLDVVDRLQQLGYGPETQVRVTMDGTFMSLSVPTPADTFTVDGEDRITPGFSVFNSEVGTSSLGITAFFWRLACSNGLLVKVAATTSFRHVSSRLLMDLPQTLANVTKELDRQKEHLRVSASTPVNEPLSLIENLAKRFELTKTESEAVKWGWAREAGNTLFCVVQSFTRAAQHPDLAPASAHKLELVGGEILTTVH